MPDVCRHEHDITAGDTSGNFFASSGASPPADNPNAPPLPPELVEALASLPAGASLSP
jgi:hypothetical protein